SPIHTRARVATKSFQWVAVAVAALSAASASPATVGATFNRPVDVDAVTAIEKQLATLNTMKDLIQYYAPDAVVYDLYAPGVYRGTRQIYDGFEQQFAQGQSLTG